jgi:hypothetical protein
MRKAILNYTTTIEAAKTVGEIEAILASHGAKAVLKEYDGESQIAALSFRVDSSHGELEIRIPIKIEAIMKILHKRYLAGKVTRRYTERPQAVRIAWRIAKDWLEVQMAMLETEQAEIGEIFLAHLLTPSGQTFFQAITERNLLPVGKKEGAS